VTTLPDRAAEALHRVARGERVVLRGRLAPWLLLLGGGAAFSAAGIAMMVGPLSSLPFGSSRWDGPFTVVMGAVAVLFFGVVGGSVALHGLRHRRHALVLEPAGLRNQGGELVPWSHVVGTERVLQPRTKRPQVLVRVTRQGSRAWRTGIAPLARWMHALTPTSASLPHVAGLEPEELGLLVELLRSR
jgi:hypothetical protein